MREHKNSRSARTHWGSFSAPPDLLAAIGERVLLLSGRERSGEGRGSVESDTEGMWKG